jgi:uncharacterized protein (DUF111 family)
VSLGGERELTTPTGASLLVTLVDSFSDEAELTPVKVGLGAGSDVGDFLNATRVILGIRGGGTGDMVDLVETSVDDATPESLAHAAERLIADGALDVSILPSLMKKGRSGHLIRVLAQPDSSDRLADILLAETGSLGARIFRRIERRKLERKVRSVKVELGGRAHDARIKLGFGPNGRILSVKPEYADVAAICESTGLEFPRVYRALLEAATRDDLSV